MDSEKPTILLVDDNLNLLVTLKMFLEENNFKIITANNGEKGLESLSNMEIPPDLIISDIMMPIIDNYEFYMKVSENLNWKKIPFFFLSVINEPFDVRFAKILGADDYITKPFELVDMLEKIRKIVKRSKNEKLTTNIIKEKIDLTSIEKEIPLKIEESELINMFYTIWDDKKGLRIIKFFPEDFNHTQNLNEMITSVVSSLVKIFDLKKIFESNRSILRLEKDIFDMFVLIEKSKDDTSLSGKRILILGVTSNKVHYFQSLRIQEILDELANKINNEEEWNIKEYWDKILNINKK